MLSKKNQQRDKSVARLRDLMSQLKTTLHESDDLARQARDEVGYALRGSDLKPARSSSTTPSRKKKAANRKAGKKKR